MCACEWEQACVIVCGCLTDACAYDLYLYRLQCNGVCTDLPSPATYHWPRTWSSVSACPAKSGIINMYYVCVSVHMYADPCACCAFAALEVMQHCVSPVEHLEGCQRDEWLPLYRLLLCFSTAPSPSPSLSPQCPMLHFSFPLPFHITSPSFFSSLPSYAFSTPPFPLHLIFLLSFCFCFILSIFNRIACHVTTFCRRVEFRKSRHNPVLKGSLLLGVRVFKLALQSRMLSIHKNHKPCC